jgi:serine/threonine protein kinase
MCEIVRLTSIDQKYEIISEVGRGTYGKVFKCRDKETGLILALKRINILRRDDGFPLNTIREIKLLRSLNHDNIIGLRAVVTSAITDFGLDDGLDSNVHLAFDYCEFDLYGLLYYKGDPLLTSNHVLSYIRQLLIALKVCRDNNIVHRDLKPANLFVTRDNILRLGDFGLARKIVESQTSRYTSHVITLYYRCPELLMDCSLYGYEVDMWSVGCIIYEMITKRTLFQPKHQPSNEGQLEAIWAICGTPDPHEWPEVEKLEGYKPYQKTKSRPRTNHLQEHLEQTIPPEFQGVIPLLLAILRLTPSKRISAEDATLHAFLRGFGKEIEPSNLAPISSREELHQMGVYNERKKKQADERSLSSERVKPEEVV